MKLKSWKSEEKLEEENGIICFWELYNILNLSDKNFLK